MSDRTFRKPPPLEGVGASRIALPSGAWRTVLEFLVEHFAHVSADEWRARMERGHVLDARFAPLALDAPFIAAEHVFYYRRLEREPPIPFAEMVLFQDDLLVVADKPHFLPVIPTGRYLQETLLVRLKRRLNIDTLAPLHRIDRETAGIVVFAVNAERRRRYFDLFRERRVHKEYEAIARHRPNLTLPLTVRNRLQPSAHFMQMHAIDGEPNAETRIELIEHQGARARYRLIPITGKRHQLRVHLAHLDAPIENDRIYPVLLPEVSDPAELDATYRQPLQLLAKSIEFRDPYSGEMRRFESRRKLNWP